MSTIDPAKFRRVVGAAFEVAVDEAIRRDVEDAANADDAVRHLDRRPLVQSRSRLRARRTAEAPYRMRSTENQKVPHIETAWSVMCRRFRGHLSPFG